MNTTSSSTDSQPPETTQQEQFDRQFLDAVRLRARFYVDLGARVLLVANDLYQMRFVLPGDDKKTKDKLTKIWLLRFVLKSMLWFF